MKQHFFLAIIIAVLAGALAAHRLVFPPPPADYRIVYLGADTCGICVHWKANVLPVWRSDPASHLASLELATKRGDPWKGGFGHHDDVFQEALGHKKRIAYPSFVLYNHDEIERVFVGLSGWRQIEKRVRAEARRAELRHSASKSGA